MSRDIVVREFAKAVDAGNAAVFVGAGISKGADYPDWKGLIQEIALRLELPVGEDLIGVAQFAVNQSRNRAVVNEVIVETFGQQRPIPQALQALAKLPIRTIWTTNYDRLIESSLEASRKKVDVKIRQADLARTIPGRDVVLYKMHGDYQHPDEAILSREDYEDYQRTRPLFADCLTADLLDKTFLFLGVGFNDPNLNWLLGRIRSLHGSAPKQHYWLVRIPRSDPNTTRWETLRLDDLQRFGVRAVPVANYDDIPDTLNAVRNKCDELRRSRTVFISGSIDPDFAKAGYVRETAQCIVERCLDSGLRIATGLGSGLGDYTVSAAFEHLAKRDRIPRLDQVTVHPYPLRARLARTESEVMELWTKYRSEVIGTAASVIFLCGRTKDRTQSGVWREYQIAREQGCCLVPIAASGGMAAEIWNEVRKDFASLFPSSDSKVEDIFAELNKPGIAASELANASVSLVQRVTR